MKNIGAWLIIAFGCLLTVGNLGAGGAEVGVLNCGSNVAPGVPQTCPHGSIAVTKTVVGTGTAPAGGWTVAIGSANCAAGLVGRNDLVLTIPAAGGVGTVTGLFVATDISGNIPCQYTVTETAVAGWTPSFLPAGPTYTVAANQTTAIALTNTADPTTTTTIAATTTTIAATSTTIGTTTTIAAATSTTAGDVGTTTIATIATATPTAAADVPTTATPPMAIALPATGSRSTRPATYIGLALIALGTLILINRRRQSHSPTE